MLFQYNNNVLYGGDVSRLSKPIITRYQCAVPKHGVCLWLCFCVRTHNQCKNVSQKSKRTNNKKAKFQYMSVQHITIGTRTMIGCLERHSADVSFFHVCPLLRVCVYKSAESPLQMNTTNGKSKMLTVIKWSLSLICRCSMVVFCAKTIALPACVRYLLFWPRALRQLAANDAGASFSISFLLLLFA